MSTNTGRTVTVDPAACRTVAALQSEASRTVADRAAVEALGPTGLTATFGVIGAEFLAALARTGAVRARTLDRLARTHDQTSRTTIAAGHAYRGADAETAGALTRTQGLSA